MKPQINRDYTHPAEMTTFEYLDEHLYQVALRGGYQEEFNQVKEHLEALKGFSSAGELMQATRKNGSLRKQMVKELKELWRSNNQLRPASGAILMLAMWVNAPAASEDYWYKFFVRLAKGGEEV